MKRCHELWYFTVPVLLLLKSKYAKWTMQSYKRKEKKNHFLMSHSALCYKAIKSQFLNANKNADKTILEALPSSIVDLDSYLGAS